jgi:hypothetical protein
MAPAVGAFCDARQRRSALVGDAARGTDPSVVRERRYWAAFAELEQGKFDVALRDVDAGLAALGTLPNDELRWRLAAVGRAAAISSKDASRADEFETMARTALGRVRASWKTDLDSYLRRPDLDYLRTRAGLQTQ